MIETQNLPLDRMAELNAVRALGSLVQRRWNLPLNLVGHDGRVQPILGKDAPLDQVELDRVDRVDHIDPIVVEPSHASAMMTDPKTGLSQMAAPIRLSDPPIGWVVAPGFVTEGSRQQGDQPVLSGSDQCLLRELVETVAAEIVAFHGTTDAAGDDEPVNTRYDYGEIIGKSRPMRQLYRLLDKVIDSDSTVLIEGQNGTGKELIAKAIHYNSRRKDRPFVVQNCSAFNDNLLDSELFGHKKGAFTGAIADKLGLFAVADGGTFFLDEIGDMSPSLQVKLLRVLQEGTFIPVGDTQAKRVDVRIIAATNRSLRAMMASGEFREDLYYRVNVISITPPPLRQRRADIPLLVDHFLHKHAAEGHPPKTLTRECVQLMMRHHWPGNVRELENEIERLVVLTGDDRKIGVDLLSARISKGAAAAEPAEQRPRCLPDAMTTLERSMILEVLRRNQWNKTRAAQELRISRRNLIRKVQKYGLDNDRG